MEEAFSKENRLSKTPDKSGSAGAIPPFLEIHRYSFNFVPSPDNFGVGVLRGERNKPCADYLVLQEMGNKLLAVVLDGVGGSREPQGASYYAADAIKDEVSLHLRDIPDRENLRQALNEANQYLRGDHCGSETTATALLLDRQTMMVSWAAAGNTRLYHVYGSGFSQINKDQGVGSFLFSCLGRKSPEIQAGQFDVRHHDLLFICSDGVHEMIPQEKLKGLLLSGKTPQEIAESLMMNVIEVSESSRKIRDDQGIIVIRV